MAKTRRARRTEAQWRAVIGEQTTSGMEIADFCDIHDIPIATFRRWQRNLLSSAQTETAQFIEIPKTEEPEVSATQRIELDLGNGMTLRVYS